MTTLDQRSELTVVTDRWDNRRYEDTAYKVPPFREARARLHDVTPTAFNECRDLFQLFVKPRGELVPQDTVRDDHKRNWQANSAVQEHPKFKELHWMTANDAVGSALAVSDIMDELIPLYKRSEELQKQLDKQQERQEELLQTLEFMAQAQESGDEAGAQAAQEGADSLQAEIDAQQMGLDAKLESFGSAAQAAVGRGMAKATEKAEDSQTMARGWGLDPAELAQQDPTERLELAKLVQNDRIKQAAKFLGALQNMANSVVRMRQGLPGQVTGIRLSDELEYVLPEQMAMLDDPDMVWQFLSDFDDLALLSFDIEGEEHKGQGGLAVGTDISTSMTGIPISWAIALTLALAMLAFKQNRPFVCVFFNTHVQKRIHLTKNNFVKNLAEMASIGTSGGTCFTEPLDQLLAGLEAEATNNTTQSDIVFITDDQCGVPDFWLDQYHRRMDKIGGKTWGISIGGYSHTGPLWDICEGAVWNVTDFHPQSTKPIKAIFEGIAKYRKEKASRRSHANR